MISRRIRTPWIVLAGVSELTVLPVGQQRRHGRVPGDIPRGASTPVVSMWLCSTIAFALYRMRSTSVYGKQRLRPVGKNPFRSIPISEGIAFFRRSSR